MAAGSCDTAAASEQIDFYLTFHCFSDFISIKESPQVIFPFLLLILNVLSSGVSWRY